jgi:maleylpyruvate isomerase
LRGRFTIAVKLYTYFRSSAAYRVRIALHLKGLSFEAVPVHLRRGEQAAAGYLQANPGGLVPALEDSGEVLSQSLSIIEYLDEVHPSPPLLPSAPRDRAFVRGVALSIACDIHPLDNLRVLRYLQNDLGVDDAARDRWYAHWIAVGFSGLEARLSRDARVGRFCFGETPTLADVCLVPQVANAERMQCALASYPTVCRIAANARELAAFRAAAPDSQPDAE